jgi:putative spermidine/putrescine transport system permease protein
MAFLLLPLVIVVLASFNSGEMLSFPPQGFSLRWYEHFFNSEPFMNSLFFSLWLAALAMAASTLLGTAAALYVVRFAGRWRDMIRLLIVTRLLLPEILSAVALLFFFYSIGLGKTVTGLVIGHVLITLPFVFLAVASVLYNFDSSLEEAARSLGANQLSTFRRVTLPLIKPGVISGALLAFIVSFDLFAVSLLLKGIGLETLPIQLFDYVTWDFDPTAAAVSTVSIAITMLAVLLIDRIVGLRSLRFLLGRSTDGRPRPVRCVVHVAPEAVNAQLGSTEAFTDESKLIAIGIIEVQLPITPGLVGWRQGNRDAPLRGRVSRAATGRPASDGPHFAQRRELKFRG